MFLSVQLFFRSLKAIYQILYAQTHLFSRVQIFMNFGICGEFISFLICSQIKLNRYQFNIQFNSSQRVYIRRHFENTQ